MQEVQVGLKNRKFANIFISKLGLVDLSIFMQKAYFLCFKLELPFCTLTVMFSQLSNIERDEELSENLLHVYFDPIFVARAQNESLVWFPLKIILLCVMCLLLCCVLHATLALSHAVE